MIKLLPPVTNFVTPATPCFHLIPPATKIFQRALNRA